ncbi:uncharacterized protein A1O9_02538 [Exophiala aquamarina CBS 119918]|uniref:RING-CH-type domain-containing protein n=1 Tax=Exophiala aquamarina CBS 119918 TaxID=1182545 RepID=A0A072PLK4_9EURO|nr:uncharacterized protein A1O9_02538 [Exophiala aquamarina CBS 119918]KEF60974.1 hypothetical protein A1O9_02538 [Exophiala aquamarina CBS 119918]
MSSEDSDTSLLNNPASYTSENNAPSQSDPERPANLSRTSTFGKKCWICMSEASEDDQTNPPVWRSPCRCSLTAHEDCLLDWVANLEDPKTIRRKGPPQILCPQCKSEIKIARPRSYIVDAYRTVDRSLAKLVLPAVGLSFLGSMWTGLWIHGFSSVYVVFGEKEAERLFKYALSSRHYGALAAYSLVPINLVLSRTNYADFVLPSGTLFILSTQITERFEIDMTVWPPLPSTVFACLPAVRTAYNWVYHQAFCDLNKKWLSEVQPRHQEPVEGQENNIADAANAEEAAEAGAHGGLVIEFDVDLNGDAGGDGGDENEDEAGDQPAGGDGQNAAQPGNNHVHRLLGDRGDMIVEGTSTIGQTIFGALAFPIVASGMGSLLKLALPSAWLGSANTMNGRPGLLRTKWGRSVVGGALFVVLKDALVIYCRWRLAQSHRQRRIMDYNKVTKKYVT